MKQMDKMFSISCHNNNSGKGDIITDIKRFHKTMLMEIIATPDVRKKCIGTLLSYG